MLLMAEREPLSGTISQEYPHRLVNVVQAMTIACVCRRTIYNWVRENRVEWVRTAGGQLRIYADSLLRRPKD